MSSGRKCFSQVKTLSFFILSLKSWSISRVFVISLSQSALHFLCASSFAAGSFQIPIPFTLLHVPQPKTAQLSPGMVFYNLLQNLKRSNYSTQTEYSTHFASYTLSLFRYLEIFKCTVSVTWSSKNLNKDMLLWSSPAFLTSLLY